MNDAHPRSRAFQIFSRLVVFVAVLLIWWGAATTTKQAGMVFADWPLSLGSFNPPGWLDYMVPFLEHSHRLLAKLVGVLVLILFSWAYVRSGKQALEVVLLVLVLVVTLGVFIAAGDERFDAGRKQMFLTVALGLALLPIGWLLWSWKARSWTLVEKLTALALLMVTTQAIFGGLRVTEISDVFAVIHGCFAQAFFCVLILIAMASGGGWENTGFTGSVDRLRLTKIAGTIFTGLIFLQLILGAKMRHFHRSGVPDDDLFRTQGQWIPGFEDPIIAVLFLHKFTAVCVLLFALGIAIRLFTGRKQSDGRDFRLMALIVGLILFQIVLGLSVIGTEKSFWVTNVHVLNGLSILALAFVFAVRAWRGRYVESGLANPSSGVTLKA
ncbi:MAG: COX15/CtaA family protein [Verrucomicrobiales bacterium]|nr:COX15/CtaA family protein [bacterium]MDF2375706.1 COX15/CtaA family protein [Verrucomicrobiales bacterium]